jgi:hypothetical protein
MIRRYRSQSAAAFFMKGEVPFANCACFASLFDPFKVSSPVIASLPELLDTEFPLCIAPICIHFFAPIPTQCFLALFPLRAVRDVTIAEVLGVRPLRPKDEALPEKHRGARTDLLCYRADLGGVK